MKPYFIEHGFKLYLADSLLLLDELEEESVDMIFADLEGSDSRIFFQSSALF